MSIDESGKTFRRIPHHVHQEPLLTIETKNFKREYVDLFDQRYWKSVSYSMKKKNRWMLSTLLQKDFYNLDNVIIYKEYQSLWNDVPYKTGYLFDSLTKREFGSQISTDRKLNGKFINGKSIIHTIENEHNHTKQELAKFEKSKFKSVKLKKSRKHHKPILPYIPQFEESLSPKEEYVLNLENRKDCIYINTSVHINDFSKINAIKTTDRKRTQTSGKHQKNSKKKRNFSKIDIFDYHEDFSDFEESEVENEIINNEETYQNYIRQSTKPIILSENDFILKNIKRNKKKKYSKNRFCHDNLNKEPKIEFVDDINRNYEKSDFFVDLKRDILPFITIDLPLHVFTEDLEAILNMCHCWFSNTLAVSILIDLSNVLDKTTENYLVLKLNMSKDSENISLKILFNINDFNLDKLLDNTFENVRDILKVLHEINKPICEKVVVNQKVMILDKPIEVLKRIWSTKPMKDVKDFFKYHDEWRKNVFTSKDIDKIISRVVKYEIDLIEICEICFSEVYVDDLIIFNECAHKICEECLASHLIYRLENGMINLCCPGVECKSEFDCVTILQLIFFKQYRKRLKILETNIVKKKGSQCFECGTITTMNDIESEETLKRLEYKCYCGRIICSRCGKTQHWPSSCYEHRKHNQKLLMLKDIEIFSEKRTPLILDGINCPKCMYFTIKINGCNHMSCSCGAHFCWLCGDANDEGQHNVSGFPCFKLAENHHLTFDLTYVSPGPSEIRPKFYILSLQQRLNSLEVNRQKLFYFIKLISSPKSKFDLPYFDVKQLEDQFKQLIIITENVFVKVYQLDKRKHLLQNYLKSSACVLLFYQKEIKQILEVISYFVKQSQKNNYQTKQIKENLFRLSALLTDVNQYINHMRLVL